MSESERVGRREMECIARCGGRCKLIDHSFGFRHSLPMDECDACFAAGGCTPKGHSWRSNYVQLGIATLKARGLDKFPPHIGEAVIARHAKPEEVPALTAQLELSKKKVTGSEWTVWPAWTGWEWVGYPWPKRIPRALWVFLRTMLVSPWVETRHSWQRMKQTGCGCNVKAKRAVYRMLGKSDPFPELTPIPPSPSSSSA